VISARPSKTLIAMPFLEDSLSMSKSMATYGVSDKYFPTAPPRAGGHMAVCQIGIDDVRCR
jgi:hypothetical protein